MSATRTEFFVTTQQDSPPQKQRSKGESSASMMNYVGVVGAGAGGSDWGGR